MSNEFLKYREHLVQADQKSQEDFDKTLITLSSGGLGVSIVFLQDLVTDIAPWTLKLLLSGWICWTLSLTTVLFSFYTSKFAIRAAIKQLDCRNGERHRACGILSVVVETLNCLGGLLFVSGVSCIVYFAYVNLANK